MQARTRLRPDGVGSVSVFDATVTFYSETITQDGHRHAQRGSAFAKSKIVCSAHGTGADDARDISGVGTGRRCRAARARRGTGGRGGGDASQRRSRHETVDTARLVEKSLTSCENAILGTTPPDGSGYYWQQSQAVQIDYAHAIYDGYPCNRYGWEIMERATKAQHCSDMGL